MQSHVGVFAQVFIREIHTSANCRGIAKDAMDSPQYPELPTETLPSITLASLHTHVISSLYIKAIDLSCHARLDSYEELRQCWQTGHRFSWHAEEHLPQPACAGFCQSRPPPRRKSPSACPSGPQSAPPQQSSAPPDPPSLESCARTVPSSQSC